MFYRNNFLALYIYLYIYIYIYIYIYRGWSGGAMDLVKLPVPGRPTILIIVGQEPTALAVGTGGGCLDIFFSRLSYLLSYSLSLGDGPI